MPPSAPRRLGRRGKPDAAKDPEQGLAHRWRTGYACGMGHLRPALLCALTLLAPGAAHAQEWKDLNRTYMESVVGLLKRLRSTREHWAFIVRAKVDLEVTDNPAHVDDNVVGAYDMIERRMFIDEVRLMEGAEQMMDAGASAKTAAEVLAWKSLPTIVHEITHAKNHEQVRRLVGGSVSFPNVEDEQVAFYEGCLALFEMFEERPELWDKDRILDFEEINADILKAWLAGPGVLDRVVADTYAGRPVLLKETSKELLLRVDRRIESLRRSIAAMRAAQGAAQTGGPEMAGMVRRQKKDLPGALRYAEGALASQLSTRKILADPGALERLRAFYRESLADRRARLEARRPSAP